jgi:hypothetical protein
MALNVVATEGYQLPLPNLLVTISCNCLRLRGRLRDLDNLQLGHSVEDVGKAERVLVGEQLLPSAEQRFARRHAVEEGI